MRHLPVIVSRHAKALTAFIVYVGLSAVFFLDTTRLRTSTLGYSIDVIQFVWFLNWWPFALAHHLNPMICRFVWYPTGYNMTWATSVPLLALVAAPVTIFGGPVLSYNLLMLAAPAFAAFTAYLLIFEITAAWRASLAAGFLFGFCPPTYLEMQSGELNLATTCLVPLAVFACLRFYHGRLSARGLTVWLTILMLLQLGISAEVLATSCVMGALAWMVFLICMPAATRPALRRMAICVLSASGLAVVLASPFLWVMARGAVDVPAQINPPVIASNDPLQYIFPVVKLPGWRDVPATLLRQLLGFAPDRAAIFGLPLITMIGLFALRQRRFPVGRAILITTSLLVLASMGPNLHWNGRITSVWLPWRLIGPVPLIGVALPARFDVFATLGAAIIAGAWLASPGARLWRFVLGGLACLLLVPAVRPVVVSPPWRLPPFLSGFAAFTWSPWPEQSFFGSAAAAAMLPGRPNILVFPFGQFGPSQAWQVESKMAFTMTGGYVGFRPAREDKWRVVDDFYMGPPRPGFGAAFSSFCHAHFVRFVVVGPGAPPAIVGAIRALHFPEQAADGFEIFAVPAGPMEGPAPPA